MLQFNSRYIRGSLSNKKLFCLLCILFTLLVVYAFAFYKNDECEKVTIKNSEQKVYTLEEVQALKYKWASEYTEKNAKQSRVDEPPQDSSQKSVLAIECFINNDYAIACLKESSGKEDVYMPFTFLQKYFDVYGKMKHYDGYDRFEFLHSFAAEVKPPSTKYNYKGVFMTFDSYNVEARDRVKCISAQEGVPISTQWGPQGYFYPIQISQFGLSHYSKKLTQKPEEHNLYESGKHSNLINWKKIGGSKIEIKKDSHRGEVIYIDSPESLSLGVGATLLLDNTIEHVLSFDFKFLTSGSITVYVDTNTKKQFSIHYITQDFLMDFNYKYAIKYGIGTSKEWKTLTRDLLVDLRKGVGFTKSKQIKKSNILIKKVSKIVIRGRCLIDNITLSTTAHMNCFRDAVNWIQKSQDAATGGWKIDVERRLSGYETLKPGWMSAMGQGQAMSLLARAYYQYNETKFIKTLSNALKPFQVPSVKGGVRAVFMNKYTWYEEYPTSVGSFVLNGFLYSLIGLYDYKTLIEELLQDSNGKFLPHVLERFQNDGIDLPSSYKDVCELYSDGLESAVQMLPLFDGGSRTFYDLRHFMLKTQPNVARWDYHTTHLSQLALFMTISDHKIFKDFFKSWSNYAKGIVADHN